ncbi:MAG: hypothetical protein B7Z15_22070, partial [Rhizobiales bacterium 32-66-8]
PEDKGRDGCRTPIPWDEGDAPNGFTSGTPWLPVKPAQSALNVASQNADAGSTLAFYRTMLAWRKTHDVLLDGDITFFKTSEPVLAFRRSKDDAAMLIVFNLSPEPRDVTLTGVPSGTALAPVSQHAALAGKTLQLGANGYAFIPFTGASKARVSY